jgi:hypothetical protein
MGGLFSLDESELLNQLMCMISQEMLSYICDALNSNLLIRKISGQKLLPIKVDWSKGYCY